MQDPPGATQPPPKKDPEKLRKALKEAGIPVVEYTPYQHPKFQDSLGFTGKPPTEPGKVSVMVIEPQLFAKDDGDRHGEYASAVANTFADGLSGRNIDVVYADANPQMLGFHNLEETGGKPEEFPKKRALPPQSNAPENIAKKRAVYAQADVASVSMIVADPYMAYGNAHTQQAKDAWQDVNTAIAFAAGNQGEEHTAPESRQRINKKDSSALVHFPHYSVTVGATEKNDKGEIILAKYSSLNGPTFLASPPHAAEKSKGQFKYVNLDRLDSEITQDARYETINDIDDDRLEEVSGKILGDHDSHYSLGEGHIPAILDRGAEHVRSLQPEGKKEALSAIRARHEAGLKTYLFGAVKKKLEEEYKLAKEHGETTSASGGELPEKLPTDDVLKKIIHTAVTTRYDEEAEWEKYIKNSEQGEEPEPPNPTKGHGLNEWADFEVNYRLSRSTEAYFDVASNHGEPIAGSVGEIALKPLWDEKAKEIKEKLKKEGDPDVNLDAEGYNTQALEGTSFAAPVIAGQIAALKELHPNATNDDIFWAMASTAQPIYEVAERGTILPYRENAAGLRYNDTHAGFGQTDFAAANKLLGESTLPPAQTKEVVGDKLHLADHRAEGHLYSITLPEGINTTKATIELQFQSDEGKTTEDTPAMGEMILISPSGDEALLSYATNNRYAIASTNAFMNTNGKGEWNILIPASEKLEAATITLQGLEPDDVRMNRRPPPDRAPLKHESYEARMVQTYKVPAKSKEPVEGGDSPTQPEEADKKPGTPDKEPAEKKKDSDMEKALRQAHEAISSPDIAAHSVEQSNAHLPTKQPDPSRLR